MSSPDSVQSSSSSQPDIERLFEADANSLFEQIVVEPLIERVTDYIQSLYPGAEELLIDRSYGANPRDAVRPRNERVKVDGTVWQPEKLAGDTGRTFGRGARGRVGRRGRRRTSGSASADPIRGYLGR